MSNNDKCNPSEDVIGEWREEFIELKRGNINREMWDKFNISIDGKLLADTQRDFNIFLAAKTSSYQLEQSLIKRLESTEAERKEYHKKFCQERQRVIDGKPSIKYEKEIAKRDELLEQAINVMQILKDETMEWLAKEESLKFLKDVQEMKEKRL